MKRDLLILLKPNFEDPDYPGERFYCWHCALLEGLLALYPELKLHIDVERVDWSRPRRRVIELVGEENQSLPILVFAADRSFISGAEAIMEALSSRYGVPRPHP